MKLPGWVPDASKPCYGLPGFFDEVVFFDPLSFSNDRPLNEIKRWRESEVHLLLRSRIYLLCLRLSIEGHA